MMGAEPDTPADAGVPPDADGPADGAAAASVGTPEAGGTGAQPAARAVRVAGKVHRFLVPGLLVLATVVGIAATFAIWVNRQALSTPA